jgi:hypothetical protein
MSRKGPDMGPERLVDRPEWRGTLGRMAEERLEQARIDRVGDRLRAALAAGAVGGSGALLAGGAKPGLAAAGAKGAGLLAAAAKIAVPLVVVAVAGTGAGVYWAKKSAEPPPPVQQVSAAAQPGVDEEVDGDEGDEVEAEETAPLVESSPERAAPVRRHRRHKHQRVRHEAAERTIPDEHAGAEHAGAEHAGAEHAGAEHAAAEPERRDSTPEVAAQATNEGHVPLADAPERHVSAENTASETSERNTPLWPKPDRSHAEAPAAEPAAERATEPAKTSGASALDAQLRMFHAAESDVKKDSPARALQRLDRLESEYPSTPLGPEIALLRTEALVRAGRSDDAIAFVQKTTEAKWPSAKKAELFRVLGDLYVSRHACGDAERAYERAFTLGLRGGRKAKAEAALRECATKK